MCAGPSGARLKAVTRDQIPALRLCNQRLTGEPLQSAHDVVRWLGAVQAQDYAGAKWGISQRTPGITDARIDRSFAEGKILRTHVMRPTWHFVAPEDIRWLLALTSPRVHAVNRPYYRKFELDDATFDRSAGVLTRALQDGEQLTRTEIAALLEDAAISASGHRLAYLLMKAELDGLICSGGRRGKQFTYALLAERAPDARILSRDESLAELARRYFTSHGPALAQDFAWWSGLTVADARAGADMAGTHLGQETIDGKTYWSASSTVPERSQTSTVHLLPNYDEYLISYKDYSPVFDRSRLTGTAPIEAVLGGHILTVGGQVTGGWRRTVHGKGVVINVRTLAPLTAAQRSDMKGVAERYERFLGMRVRVEVGG